VLAFILPKVENKCPLAFMYSSVSPAKCTADTEVPFKKFEPKHVDTSLTVAGRCKSVMLEFPYKKLSLIETTRVDDKIIFDNAVHPLNAFSSMTVSDSGRESEVSELQLKKQLDKTFVPLNDALSRLVQL